ncbi:MAG: amidohydrolase family protein [Thermoleophilaceae bacterium]
MFSDGPILPWLERLREEVPGLELFDAHTHIGRNDPDGYRCQPAELVSALEAADARAVVFAMHEPGGYSPANDLVMAEAAASEGRLTAFCRVDPAQDAAAEAERCLETGAAGIKLHPRAEGFTLHDSGLSELFALADERRRPVLVHAGRGIPALGRDALELCESYPGARVILAHAGICDLAWIWRSAADHPNLFFDTSWWSASDLLALLTLVPPGQILFGSDAPYGTPAFAATMCLRYALQAGLSPEQIRGVCGKQLQRLLDGDEPLDAGPAPGPGSLSRDPLLDRVYAFLVSAIGQMFNGVEPSETLDLARLACEVGDDAPQAAVCRRVIALLEQREQYVPGSDGRPARFAPGLHFVVVAAGLARTPDVALPPEPVPADVAERSRSS